MVLAKEQYGIRGRELHRDRRPFVAFSAVTRMSGVDVHPQARLNLEGDSKGVGRCDRRVRPRTGGIWCPERSTLAAQEIGRRGGTPLLVAEDREVLGVIHLKDIVKGGIKEGSRRLRAMGIKTVMITGDNAMTAAAIAAEAGVDDFLADAKPEDKLKLIRQYQIGRAHGRDDRRWNQRCSCACAGGCGGCHEYRHAVRA